MGLYDNITVMNRENTNALPIAYSHDKLESITCAKGCAMCERKERCVYQRNSRGKY